MADNLFTFMYWALGNGLAAGEWPKPGGDLVTGGSPRYNIYRTRDDRFLAAAPLEQKFWDNFCDLIGLDARFRADVGQEPATKREVAKRIGAQTAEHWARTFAGKDVCCSIVCSVEAALRDPHFAARGIFARTLSQAARPFPPCRCRSPSQFRAGTNDQGYPELGEANGLLDDASHA